MRGQSDNRSFILDVKALFLRQRKENLGPYLYSEPNPEIENDPVCGERYYQTVIYEVPTYYLYRDEVELIQTHANSMSDYVPLEATVIEFGPGAGRAFIKKTLPFLRSIEKLNHYAAVDLCKAYLEQCKAIVEREFPLTNIQVIEANFIENCELLQKFSPPQVVWFKGSTIANLNQQDCVKFLHRLSKALQPEGILIVGLDSNQDEASLRKAYENEDVARFITNIFHRIKRDCDLNDFDPTAFKYRFEWNAGEHRVKHNAIAIEHQKFVIDNTSIEIAKGDVFNVVSSYKYPIEYFQEKAIDGGFKVLDCLMDSSQRMVIHVLQASQLK